MADVQLENGYTRIANELLEALTMYDFSGQERKFIDAVIRLSYGCAKKTATFPSWAACECFGIHRQKVRGLLQRLEEDNVVIVDYDIKTVGIQKYYSKWKRKPKEISGKKGFQDLINYNIKCNLQVTNVTTGLQPNGYKSNLQVTKMSPTGYTDVTHRLQEQQLNPHYDKPKTAPKDNKEIKDNNYNNARVRVKQENCHSAPGIQSDLTIIQGAILQKWGKQIIQSPPVSHITTAIQEYGKDKVLEAIDRTPLILKSPDPNTLMAYIGSVAEHPTWYVKKLQNGANRTQEQKLADAQRVYELILNDEGADKTDPTYIDALKQAKGEVERLREC